MTQDVVYTAELFVRQKGPYSHKENIIDFHVIMSTYNQSAQRARYGE